MKSYWSKSIKELVGVNQQDQKNITECLGAVSEWAEKLTDFNALNHFDRSSLDRQVTELFSREEKGRLYGVPLVIKDNISIAGWPTTAASKILKGYRAPYDATVISRLRQAGAIFVGRANMDEFAMGSSGENSADGFSRNPWDRERVPGGSSSGSAIAAAVGLGWGALGSDTGGSIRLPASFCGVVGLKPTYGLVSRYGLLALGSSLDQIGPLTRRVEDAAEILTVIAGGDDKDATSRPGRAEDYVAGLTEGVKKIKVGLVKEMYEQADPTLRKIVDGVAERIEATGGQVELVELPIIKYSIPVYYIIQSSECSANLARYDGIRYGYSVEKDWPVRDLAELYLKTRQYGLGDEVKRRIILGTYSLSSGYYDDYFQQAARVRTKIIEGFNNLFNDYDILLGLTAPTTAFKIGEKSSDPLSMYLTDIMTIAVSMAGLPAISVPAGFCERLPVGVQLIGPKWSEKKIIQLAYQLEKHYRWDEYIPTEIISLLEE